MYVDTTTANVDDDTVTNVEELELAELEVVEVLAAAAEDEDEEGASPESSSWNLPLCARMPA